MAADLDDEDSGDSDVGLTATWGHHQKSFVGGEQDAECQLADDS